MTLSLGYSIGYWSSGPPSGALEGIKEAERLGFDSVWTAEAYGSDALTPLAWWGAATERIRLGTGIIQMSARTPAATAMAAMTMDHLSGGRFILEAKAEAGGGPDARYPAVEHLCAELSGLEIVSFDEAERQLQEGRYHVGAVRTARIVARKAV